MKLESDMKEDNKSLLPQFVETKKKKLNREEKFFNSRINTIKELKEKIGKANEALEEFQRLGQKELAPVAQKIHNEKVKFLKILDKSYDLKYFRKKEKEKIAYLILEEIEEIGLEDEFLDELENKYRVLLYGESKAEEIDEEDEDEDEDNDFNHHNQKDMFNEFFKFLSGEEERDKKQSNRKKTANQIKAEEKKQAEEKKLSKTTRTLYTELVKVLHPDKEPDEDKRLQKTEIMKKVTEAYKNDDYFELMKLQIEYLEGVGGKDIKDVSKDTLKQYNKILLEQKKALELEWSMLTNPFSPFGIMIENCVKNISYLHYKIKTDKSQMNSLQKKLANNNKLFEQDKKNLREYLKSVELDDDDDDEFGGFLDDFFGNL